MGVTYGQTFVTENDNFGIVDPGLLPGLGCPNAAIPQCAILAPFDLTAGGSLYNYRGHTDVKEAALYAQDDITKGPWSFNVGFREDFYNGLQADVTQPEPRAGIAYNIKKTNTVLRISYARTLESPFNENLVLSGTGCTNPVVNSIMTVAQGFSCSSEPLIPGFRNEFHAGLQQAIGKYFVLSGEYIWKYTHNAYDFNVFGATPIYLPIEWHSSKIPGYAIKATVPEIHGFQAFVVMSHVNARFFPPTLSGIAPPPAPGVFRIDHDENFAQTTHMQYQPWKLGPWFGFNWRYDSGLVAGATPFATQVGGLVDASFLTADQQFQAGLFCGSVHATPTMPISANSMCPASQFGSTLLSVPAAGTENDDHNPPRIAPRNLFDLAIGDDDLFHKSERYKWSARVTILNLTNNVAAIQLPVHLQRHALRLAANGHRGAGLPLLARNATAWWEETLLGLEIAIGAGPVSDTGRAIGAFGDNGTNSGRYSSSCSQEPSADSSKRVNLPRKTKGIRSTGPLRCLAILSSVCARSSSVTSPFFLNRFGR